MGPVRDHYWHSSEIVKYLYVSDFSYKMGETLPCHFSKKQKTKKVYSLGTVPTMSILNSIIVFILICFCWKVNYLVEYFTNI